METKKDFFISYTHADEQWAKWIAAVLEANGYHCIIQAWDFEPGGNFVQNMHNALINTERFIAVLSPDYLVSLYCQAEWTAAFTKDPNSEKRLFIPVRVADIEPEGLLAPIIYIDLYGITDEEVAEKHLLNGVDTKATPRNRPSFPGTKKVRFPNSLPFNNIPYIRNHYFTGRDTILETMHEEFNTGNAVSLTQTITGLGGIGKTQTALEYAYRYADKYDWLWWITAESEATVIKAYQAFALEMRLIDATQQKPDIIRETVLTWMDTHDKWLFIYDNLDSIADDTPWWPKNNRGNILITTRNQRISIGKGIDIAVFTEEEAVSFLEKRTGICNDPQNATLLSNRLGHLPLALEQAAAYIRNTITFPEYLKLLDEHGLTVLEEVDGVVDYTEPVTATWEISFEKISMGGAKQLLYLCAYIASEDITANLFIQNIEFLPSPLCEDLSDDLTAIKVWKELTRYSLLQRQEDTQSYSIHRLLQEVVRRKIDGDPQWALCWLDIFGETFDFEYGDTDSHARFKQLFPHVEAFLQVANSLLLEDEEQVQIARLYHKGGSGQLYLGNYPQALDWFFKALPIHESVFGKNHPDTASTYNNIASAYNDLGDYSKALDWHFKALPIRESVLGKNHPSTAASYNNIASVYNHLGDYSKALEWYFKALPIRESVLGKNHPDTAASYNNIALVYDHLGDYPKALDWYFKALHIGESVLGKNHPNTASTYSNIASVYDSLGDYPKALDWYFKALPIRESVFGKNHPDTAITYNNIASVYYNLGDYPKALDWYFKALPIHESVLGKNHPSTASTYNNIALVYNNLGDYSKALDWFFKDLNISESVLGKNHPDTATTYNNIASVYDNLDDYPKALDWHFKALHIRESVLGKNHPDTANTYNNIAYVYYNMGEKKKSLEWIQKAYVILKQTLGEAHPHTKNVEEGIRILTE